MRRHQAGAPAGTGGQFAPDQRPAVSADLTAQDGEDARLAVLDADFAQAQTSYFAAEYAAAEAAKRVLVARVRQEYPTAKYLSVRDCDTGEGHYVMKDGPLDDQFTPLYAGPASNASSRRAAELASDALAWLPYRQLPASVFEDGFIDLDDMVV